jgi:hypothetical protein
MSRRAPAVAVPLLAIGYGLYGAEPLTGGRA